MKLLNIFKPKFLEHEKNGIINLRDIIFVGRQFLIHEKKYCIMFISNRGVNVTWTFFDVQDRDKIYGKIKHILGVVSVE